LTTSTSASTSSSAPTSTSASTSSSAPTSISASTVNVSNFKEWSAIYIFDFDLGHEKKLSDSYNILYLNFFPDLIFMFLIIKTL